jgi:hypothetical protein
MVLMFKETNELTRVESVTGEEPLKLNADMPTDLSLDANSLFSKPGESVREVARGGSRVHAFGTSVRELNERRWETRGYGFIFSMSRDVLPEVGSWKLLGMPLSLAKGKTRLIVSYRILYRIVSYRILSDLLIVPYRIVSYRYRILSHRIVSHLLILPYLI